MNYLKDLFTTIAAMALVIGAIYGITTWSIAKADSIENNTASIKELKEEVSNNTKEIKVLQGEVEEGFTSVNDSLAELKKLLETGLAYDASRTAP